MRIPTPAEFKTEHDLLTSRPDKYVEMMSGRIEADPNDALSYFARHQGWVSLGEWNLALEDLDHADALREHPAQYMSRGNILTQLGRHREALTAYGKAEAIVAPHEWPGTWGPLFQADCHARLGDEAAAMSAMARMPDDFYPGLHGTPRGTKSEIEAELRRRAAAARHGAG